VYSQTKTVDSFWAFHIPKNEKLGEKIDFTYISEMAINKSSNISTVDIEKTISAEMIVYSDIKSIG
jgi:hypothetical protein